MTQEDVTITTHDVATIARVDSSTVRRWVKAGLLKPSAVTPGGQYRFRRSDVEKLLTPASSAS
ncbi:helix-turn-helix domain-containing protein [Microcella sp.]|uniref:helix-turn-helix domain-containing protein n=1 Tax=Microcella sp. TaxID=1913979 RepID=UPI0033148E5F